MTALIPLFLSSLPSLIQAGESVEQYIVGTKTVLAQDSAWTAVEDAAYQQAWIDAGKTAPEWLG